MRRLWILSACVALSAAVLLATDGPLTPWGALSGRTDENGYVRASIGTAGVIDGPLTLFPNLRTRTDENGYLRISVGAISLSNWTMANGGVIRGDTTSGDTWALQAYDTNTGPAYVTFATFTNGNSPSLAISPPVGGSTVSLTATTYTLTNLLASTTAPTIASGGCTSPAVTWANGTAAFKVTIGTTCTGVKTFTLTLPAATNGWVCDGQDVTTPASFTLAEHSSNTTTVVIGNYSRTTGLATDFSDSEVLLLKCSGG